MKKSFLSCGLVVMVGLFAGCGGGGGGNGGSGGEAGAGGGGGSGGAGGAGGSATGGGPAVDCSATSMAMFPTFDKSCSSKADCVLKFHTTSCCGDMLGIGMNSAEGPAFDVAEATCNMQYPACGCAAQAPKAEDGKSVVQSMDEIQVDCMSGQCNSFIP